jgi:hypothetical protein
VVKRNVSVAIKQNAQPITIEGSGRLTIPSGAALNDVTLCGPSLNANPGTTIMGLGGVLRPVKCKDAVITAAPGSCFVYRGIAPGGKSDALTSSTIRGVEVPVSGDGRRFIRELSNAAVVDPSVAQLPAFSGEWPRFFARQKFLKGHERRRELSEAALFTQELAGMAEHKSVSGSIRTKTSWAGYRSRQLDSPSRWERALLAAFRLVGYGQRPGPPFAAWIAMAVVGATVVSWARSDFSSSVAFEISDTGNYLVLFGEMLLSPFVLIRLAADSPPQGLSSLAGQVVLVARALVAVPFVFTVVALTRLVRAEWPWR